MVVVRTREVKREFSAAVHRRQYRSSLASCESGLRYGAAKAPAADPNSIPCAAPSGVCERPVEPCSVGVCSEPVHRDNHIREAESRGRFPRGCSSDGWRPIVDGKRSVLSKKGAFRVQATRSARDASRTQLSRFQVFRIPSFVVRAGSFSGSMIASSEYKESVLSRCFAPGGL